MGEDLRMLDVYTCETGHNLAGNVQLYNFYISCYFIKYLYTF